MLREALEKAREEEKLILQNQGYTVQVNECDCAMHKKTPSKEIIKPEIPDNMIKNKLYLNQKGLCDRLHKN